MAAVYNYSHYQKQAFQSERRAYRTMFALILVLVFMLSIFITIYILWRRYKTRLRIERERQLRLQRIKQQEIEKLKADYSDITERYSRNQQTIQFLKESHQAAINTVQERLDGAQLLIDELNQKYERGINLLKNENESLQARIEELDKLNSMPARLEESIRFVEEPIVKRIFELSDNPKLRIRKKEWEGFVATVGRYYPELLKDLRETPDVTNQVIYTALLLLLNIRTDDIARLLNVSGQRVTNIKSGLNYTLFGVKSARPLYENLKKRYGIYLFGK